MESEHSLTIQDRVKTAQNVDELATNGVPENDIMQKKILGKITPDLIVAKLAKYSGGK